ncbi:hypothetical protein Tco_0083609 [Tanacetum coccineum]
MYAMTSRPRTRILSRPRLGVMAASVIPISSDSSEDSVGCYCTADPLVAPEVGAVSVTSPVGVLDLVDYSSSSDSGPSKDSLPLAPELPLVSPFLCFDDSEADSESEHAEQRPKRHESLTVHDAMVLRWRDRVASRPSSPSGSSSHYTLALSSEFPLAPVVAPPRILGHFLARRLTWRRVSHRSSDCHYSLDFTLDSSSFGSSSDSSLDTSSGSPSDSLLDTSSVHSLGCNASGQSHSGPSTRVASPIDSYSPEDSREEHMEIGTADAEAATNLGISDGVGVDTEDGIGMGVEIAASDIREDEEEFETAQRQLEAGQLMASRERESCLRHHMTLSQEEFRHIRRDHDNAWRRLRRLESFVERRLGFRH